MTRINAGLPPQKLTTKHLIAEHREIVRIPNNIKSGKAKVLDIPNAFTLGAGHVKFFYDKVEYLRKRYEELYLECVRRGFKVSYFGLSFEGIPQSLMNDYEPTEQAKKLIEDRIAERLAPKPS